MRLPTEGELQVLKVLAATHTPLHGYEISLRGGALLSSVYNFLENLVEKKLIYPTGSEDVSGIKRYKYRPTARGIALFNLCEAFDD